MNHHELLSQRQTTRGADISEQVNEDRENARDALSHALKTFRDQSGKSLSQVAEDTGYDRTYLNRLENGERLSKQTLMEDLDAYYGTGKLLVKLWKMARDDIIADRFRLFVQYESTAVIMHKYMTAIPGLLQTEDYARVLLSSAPNNWSPDELEAQVDIRVSRKDILHRDPPPSLRVILDECVLRRATVDPRTWQDQLAHLVESAEQPSIVLQVLPFAAGVHDLMGGSLSLLWQADGTGVAYFEGSKSGQLIEDPEEVSQHRLSYDRVRDSALSPSASVDFIRNIMEGNGS
ncbi:helix-turn-helix transcriptional regulator [Streptomyces sp. B1866]|uniref:helix-turn-helix domain-containing protein n=1 Tax=Streptomyces sp. B1866 TaxID=3075431 RepID=UPI002890BF52|nr:helix-turn-helix transcriptional regulator [Streptomyces sp. B1866]MDT3400304.1 helix-turn-helix transcriptional regulator [Streptomyces sp. B1866]